MATLYESSIQARKGLVVLLVLVACILIYDTVQSWYKPTPNTISTVFSYYKDPDNLLGSVPKITMDSIPTDATVKSAYAIDGDFPLLPDSGYVYAIDKPREKVDTVESAVSVAARLGFTGDYAKDDTDEEVLVWKRDDDSKVLKFNKTTKNWSLSTLYFNNVDAKKLKSISTDLNSFTFPVANFITTMGLGNSLGLGSGYIEGTPASLNSNGAFFEPDNLAESRYMFLNIYRNLTLAVAKSSDELANVKDKSAIPGNYIGHVYTSDPRNGIMRLVVGNDMSDYSKDIFEWNFTDFNYSFSGSNIVRGNYALITPAEAWTKAQSGKGFLVGIMPEKGNPFETYKGLGVRKFVADASKTTMGFYEPETWTGYVTPIFIFTGRAELSDGKIASFTIFVEGLKRIDN